MADTTIYKPSGSNVNRTVTFRIEATDAADSNAGLFGIHNGLSGTWPFEGQLPTAPTANQTLAQERTLFVLDAMRQLGVIVGVAPVADSHGTALAASYEAPALEVTFETDDLGTFQNSAYSLSNPTAAAKQVTTDITDTLGIGGSSIVKTKNGLQSIVDALATVSFDGGTTGPFGVLSATGNIVLSDGTTTTAGAPTLATPGTGSGITVTFVR